MESELQSAASRISLVEIPTFAAAEVEAALTECALKMFGVYSSIMDSFLQPPSYSR